MDDLENIKITAYDLKCFADECLVYDAILPINLVIGRNNSGKSTVINLIEYAGGKDFKNLGHKGRIPSVVVSVTGIASHAEVQSAFAPNISEGEIPGNHWAFGKRFVDRKLTWQFQIPPGSPSFVSFDPPDDSGLQIDSYLQSLVRRKVNPISTRSFKHLFSDRDIFPEEEAYPPFILPNGQGATNTIRQFLTRAALPTDLVEKTLLRELNQIFEPDYTLTDITVQQLDSPKWEVFLGEPQKGRIALSQSGSGLKTILLVLANLYLIPYIERKELKEYLFGFEELENNIHPSLQRRLFMYLRNVAVEKNCTFFISTHSNVIIDLFSGDKLAQIIHVTNDGEKASISKASTYIEQRYLG
jgi:putative ATP-dependent endonuclease of OLD family